MAIKRKMKTNGWKADGPWIKEILKDIKTEVKNIKEDGIQTKIEIAQLKIQARIWGTGAAIISSIFVGVVIWLLTGYK